MAKPPGQVLSEARAAARDGNHALALECYEYFFDFAIQDEEEPGSYYGVRLSYCLREWFDLGETYPLALERLEAKAVEALNSFEVTGEGEKFHDFQVIRDRFDQADLVMEQFVRYHNTNPELAKPALRFMWNRLIEAKRWDICSAYLNDYESKYETALLKFDQAMRICLEDPTLGGEEFAGQIKGWYVRDVGNLLAALKNSGQRESVVWLEEKINLDMHSRGYFELVSRLQGRSAV